MGEVQELAVYHARDLGLLLVRRALVRLLNGAEGSFPGGYFMAGQGSQIAFVILIFWFVSRQNKLDDEHGVSEE